MASEQTWSLESLREYVRNTDGIDNKSFLIGSIDSVGRSVALFRYHIYTAKDGLGRLLENKQMSYADKMKFVFDVATNPGSSEYARIEIEANIIASIHAARNIFDIFAQVANGLLVRPPLDINTCDIKKLTNKLSPSPLKELLIQLLSDEWFQYLEAFSNTAKHRNLVRQQARVQLNENKVGIYIENFEYRGRLYEGKWAEDILDGAVSIKNRILDCGRALNQISDL